MKNHKKKLSLKLTEFILATSRRNKVFKSKQTSWDPFKAEGVDGSVDGVDGSLDGAGNAPAWLITRQKLVKTVGTRNHIWNIASTLAMLF
jgi:hypothetical protein